MKPAVLEVLGVADYESKVRFCRFEMAGANVKFVHIFMKTCPKEVICGR